MPKGVKRGVCRTCGEPADSAQGTYCAEHRPLPNDARPRPAVGASTTRASSLELELRTNLEMAGQLWSIRDPQCGPMLTKQAPEIARFWAERARQSDRVARTLDGIVSSGGWLGGLAVHLPILLMVWAHHVEPAIQARREAEAEAMAAAEADATRWTPPANDPAAQAAAAAADPTTNGAGTMPARFMPPADPAGAAFDDLRATDWPDGGTASG